MDSSLVKLSPTTTVGTQESANDQPLPPACLQAPRNHTQRSVSPDDAEMLSLYTLNLKKNKIHCTLSRELGGILPRPDLLIEAPTERYSYYKTLGHMSALSMYTCTVPQYKQCYYP